METEFGNVLVGRADCLSWTWGQFVGTNSRGLRTFGTVLTKVTRSRLRGHVKGLSNAEWSAFDADLWVVICPEHVTDSMIRCGLSRAWNNALQLYSGTAWGRGV